MESEHYSLSISINHQSNKFLLAIGIVIISLILIGLTFIIYRSVDLNNDFLYSHHQTTNSTLFNPVKPNLTEPEESFWNPQKSILIIKNLQFSKFNYYFYLFI